MTYNTIREATRAWVNGFNALPSSLIGKAYGKEREFEDFREITPTQYYCNECGYEGFEDDFQTVTGVGIIGEYIRCPECQTAEGIQEKEKYTILPIWGWLWTFDESLDEEWVEENLETVAKCGFRIYESDELGIVIGIDGAGYDFYSQHWIPLYKARGLKWHRETV